MPNEILWTSGFINERFPAPISPLGWSVLGPFVEELALRDPLRFLGYPHAETISLSRLWRGHPYTNALALHIIYRLFPNAILPEDAYRYFPDGAVQLRRDAPYPRWFDLPRVMWSLMRAFFADPFNVSPLNNYRHWAQCARAHDKRIAALRAHVNTLRDGAPRDIFDALHQAELVHRSVLRIHRWSLMDADFTVGLLKWLVRVWIDPKRADEITARLIAHVPNQTLEANSDWVRLSRDEFLAKHGHRSFSLDIAVPTFADDPTQLELLRAVVSDNRQPMANAINARHEERHPFAFWQRGLFGAVVFLARQYNGLREDQRYYWQKPLAVSRQLYGMLAERLVAQKVIAERDAIFYATHRELAEYFDDRLPKTELARIIAARQIEWREYQCEFEASPTASYPAFLRGDTPIGDASSNLVDQWHGRAISPGQARGIARIVRSSAELARVQAGDILIAPTTDPAWTPVFTRLAGLIVERGGVLSHSAVVAREYRIPGVAGIPGIVDALRDGEMVEVDGNRGDVARVKS